MVQSELAKWRFSELSDSDFCVLGGREEAIQRPPRGACRYAPTRALMNGHDLIHRRRTALEQSSFPVQIRNGQCTLSDCIPLKRPTESTHSHTIAATFGLANVLCEITLPAHFLGKRNNIISCVCIAISSKEQFFVMQYS